MEILRMITSENINRLGVLSAYRIDASPEENHTKHINLKFLIREMRLGLVALKATFPDKTKPEVLSWVINGISKKQLLGLVLKFNQCSFLSKEDSEMVLYDTHETALNRFEIDLIQIYQNSI